MLMPSKLTQNWVISGRSATSFLSSLQSHCALGIQGLEIDATFYLSSLSLPSTSLPPTLRLCTFYSRVLRHRGET